MKKIVIIIKLLLFIFLDFICKMGFGFFFFLIVISGLVVLVLCESWFEMYNLGFSLNF